MISKIWRKLVQAPSIAGCRRSLREDDIVSARNYYSKFQDSQVPRHIALGARITLLEKDSASAKLLLERAASLAVQKKDENNKYVLEYCNYFLSIINKDGRHEEHRIKALDMRPSEVFLDSLPLPSLDVLSDFTGTVA